MYLTTIWSQQAGLNVVLYYYSSGRPDGPVGHKVEWTWTNFGDTYLPTAYKTEMYGLGINGHITGYQRPHQPGQNAFVRRNDLGGCFRFRAAGRRWRA